MELKWKIKPFEALTVSELYDLLKLRSEIFVLEQNCVYLDIDGKDKITIGAQLYLKKFYESHGFVQISEMYLEDDIEHIDMVRG